MRVVKEEIKNKLPNVSKKLVLYCRQQAATGKYEIGYPRTRRCRKIETVTFGYVTDSML
jgi:hypothetical protein